jgi:hypothetical protein
MHVTVAFNQKSKHEQRALGAFYHRELLVLAF